MAKTTRIKTESIPRPALFLDSPADVTRAVGDDVGVDAVNFQCSRCGMDIEVGDGYLTESRMRRHIVCPRRG